MRMTLTVDECQLIEDAIEDRLAVLYFLPEGVCERRRIQQTVGSGDIPRLRALGHRFRVDRLTRKDKTK